MWQQSESLELVAEAADFSVAIFADWMGLSPRHLQRNFRRCLGISPGKWMYALRLRRAKAMKRSGERVTDVALQLSYSNASSLIRAMKHCDRVQIAGGVRDPKEAD